MHFRHVGWSMVAMLHGTSPWVRTGIDPGHISLLHLSHVYCCTRELIGWLALACRNVRELGGSLEHYCERSMEAGQRQGRALQVQKSTARPNKGSWRAVLGLGPLFTDREDEARRCVVNTQSSGKHAVTITVRIHPAQPRCSESTKRTSRELICVAYDNLVCVNGLAIPLHRLTLEDCHCFHTLSRSVCMCP